ncbi:AraC family transcriptional regulator [Adlercreutzia murintestinalis]|uniref:AraC family transcriptional regulator n=1 Tax=Adlercreutzia murintestinalis TaxID=2941325 RepID=UPI0020413F21|nr:AraC family transcriptional regulator [Adlercreutzia murintestinalis]
MPVESGSKSSQDPCCTVVPVPALGGERRSYSGIVQPFAAHSHGHYVIGRVRQGSRDLELNGRTLCIDPGDLIVFNPGDVHGCSHNSEELFAYDSVTIASDRLDNVILVCPDSDAADAEKAFEALMEALNGNTDEEVMERTLYLASLLESEDDAPRPIAAHDDAALRTYAHLLGHLAEPASIKDLATAEGISGYALIRAYRRRFSITPLQHLMSLRVECACELLAQGVAPSDVAVETGFADQAHLTRMFKQRLGTTPAAYRKMASKGSLR